MDKDIGGEIPRWDDDDMAHHTTFHYHSDCKSVDDKEALWSYEREEGKRQTQERFIGPIRESRRRPPFTYLLIQ